MRLTNVRGQGGMVLSTVKDCEVCGLDHDAQLHPTAGRLRVENVSHWFLCPQAQAPGLIPYADAHNAGIANLRAR